MEIAIQSSKGFCFQHIFSSELAVYFSLAVIYNQVYFLEERDFSSNEFKDLKNKETTCILIYYMKEDKKPDLLN